MDVRVHACSYLPSCTTQLDVGPTSCAEMCTFLQVSLAIVIHVGRLINTCILWKSS